MPETPLKYPLADPAEQGLSAWLPALTEK